MSVSSSPYQPAPAVFALPGKATANAETKWTSSTDSCPCFCSPGLILPHYFQRNQLCCISRQELHIKIMFDIIKKIKITGMCRGFSIVAWQPAVVTESFSASNVSCSSPTNEVAGKEKWGKDFLLAKDATSSGNSLFVGLRNSRTSK